MEPLSTTAKRELSALGGLLETLTSLNPRPFEIVSVTISLGVAAVLLVSPGTFSKAVDFADLLVLWPESHWAALFVALAFAHLCALAWLGGPRWLRRSVVMVKVVFSTFILVLVLMTRPFGFDDVLFLVYALVNACVFLQLRFGRPL